LRAATRLRIGVKGLFEERKKSVANEEHALGNVSIDDHHRLVASTADPSSSWKVSAGRKRHWQSRAEKE
jgi:hypothetical protein